MCSIGKILAVSCGALKGSADLALVVVGDLLLEDLKTLEDVSLNWFLGAGEDPDILSLCEEVGVA